MDFNYIIICDTQLYYNNDFNYVKRTNFLMEIIKILKQNSCEKSTLTIIPLDRLNKFETELNNYEINGTYDYLLMTLKYSEKYYDFHNIYSHHNNNDIDMMNKKLIINFERNFIEIEKMAYNSRPESKTIVFIYSENDRIVTFIENILKMKSYNSFNCFSNFSTCYIIKFARKVQIIDDEKDIGYYIEEHETNSDNKMIRFKIMINNYLARKSINMN